MIAALHRRAADGVLLDLNYTRDTTSGDEGLDAVTRLRAFDAFTPVIAMTAWGSIELAVEAMRRGAQDFIEKPWDNERLFSVLRTQVALGRSASRVRSLAAEHGRLMAADTDLIAESSNMRAVLDAVERVASADANVLLTGESGTGKGLIARLIHERSRRNDQNLVVVNVGSLPEQLFESELFGHVKGAFTDAKTERIGRFELADGGTLFLDEIANIPPAQQARLLRVLEDGQFERLGSSQTRQTDVRVLSATNADLTVEIEAGRFRRDLLYRLNTIHIHLPPLRERGDDALRLAQQFLLRYSQRHRRSIEAFSDASLLALQRYPWPGNVRELRHVVERAVLMSNGPSIVPADLRLEPLSQEALRSNTLDAIQIDAIRAALAKNEGSVPAAADELGMSRSALYRRMEKLRL
jgi:DNA-binding NtrC family response regulator